MTDTLRADLVRLRDEMQNDRHWAVLTGWVNKLDAILAAHPAEEDARGTTPPVPTWEEIRKLPKPLCPSYKTTRAYDGSALKEESWNTCSWCRLTWENSAAPHPENGCLWARAHAATAGEERG